MGLTPLLAGKRWGEDGGQFKESAVLANYLFAVLMPVCVCVSAVVTCQCVDLDSSACAAGLLALQIPCVFVTVFWINDCVFTAGYIRGYMHFLRKVHTYPVRIVVP